MTRYGCDVDGVLADFNIAFIQRVIDINAKDLFPPRPFDIPTWDYPQSYGYTQLEVSDAWASIIRDRTFWQNLPAYEDTKKFLAQLSAESIKGNDVYFITSRPGVAAKYQTEWWLTVHGFICTPTVLISSQKGKCVSALQCDKYIDDRWENALDVATTTGSEVYLLDRPWNQRWETPTGIRRISTFNEMF